MISKRLECPDWRLRESVHETPNSHYRAKLNREMIGSFVGLRVQVKIDEDGSSSPPLLPPGTLVRSIVGPDRETYYLVRLDHTVNCKHVKTGENWILQNLAIAPNFRGGTLEPIVSSKSNHVTVGIANMFYFPDADDPVLDFSKGEYFATGIVKQI